MQDVIRPTTIIRAPRLELCLGVKLTIVSETFQFTGSFKFRAAYNLASKVDQERIITASSGNFGQALAYACKILGKSCLVVMPHDSAQVKVDAVREYGGEVDLINVASKSRSDRLSELSRKHPEAYLASAYDDPLVIEGNATLGQEISGIDWPLDYVLVPIGGGGLSSGIVTGIRRAGLQVDVVGAEPLLANDAARSLRAGCIVRDRQESKTIADGARTLGLGQHNWPILQKGLSDIIEVTEDDIAEAVGLLFSLANVKAEPTGALGLAAVLSQPGRFRGKSVCCVVSGGNVDPEVYCRLLRSGGSAPAAHER